MIIIIAIMLIEGALSIPSASAEDIETYFVPMAPCRLFDTRVAISSSGIERFIIGTETETQDFFIFFGGTFISAQGGSAACVIPPQAIAVQINLIATSPSPGTGFMRAWKFGDVAPNASVLVWKGVHASNSVPIVYNNSGSSKDLTIRVFGSDTDVIGDAFGYYVPI